MRTKCQLLDCAWRKREAFARVKTMKNNNGTTQIKVWDLPTRLFHWTLAVLFAAAIITHELGDMDLHKLNGYAILALIIFRLAWGFVGSTTSRFSHFVRGVAAGKQYAKDLRGNTVKMTVGHNPLGGWMVVLLLVLLLVQAISGLFAADEVDTKGPLHDRVSEAVGNFFTNVHDTNITILYVLVGIHIAANLWYWWARRQNLIKPMITGNQEVSPSAAAPGLRFTSPGIALLILAAAAGLVTLIVQIG